MKIVTFFESLKIGGGVEKVQATVGTSLSENGHEVIYLVMEDRTPRNEHKGTIVSLHEPFIFGFGLKKIISLFRLGKRIARFCQDETVDVILGQGDFFYMVVAMSKWLYKNPAKCVGVVHTTIGVWHPVIRSILIFLLKKLDFIILISHDEEKTFLEKYGFSQEKCEVIYNSIDTRAMQKKQDAPLPESYQSIFSPEKFIFINIGRCTYQKNQALLLNAYDRVYAQYHNTELVILGQGDLMEKLEQQRSTLASGNHIHLLGNQENVYPFLKHADCFVLSSRFEGFPMVLIEVANLSGLPALSTNCPTGPNELLGHKFLSPIEEEDKLAENMIKIIEDPEYRKENIDLLSTKKALFSHEVIASKWNHLVETWSS